MKFLLCMIIFLILGILCKKDITYQYFTKTKIYQDNITFSTFRKFYNRYLGGIFPVVNLENTEKYASVFNEKISYQSIEDYLDGARLIVSPNYLIPNMESGIVVYIGKKENYGNVIIVENNNGIRTWYGNVCNSLVKLYDQIQNGNYLGESCGTEIYLVYTKGNEILNYKNYI